MTASLIRHTRAGGSSFAGMLLLAACSAALSAPVCGPGEICLDFNDNLMPMGWSGYSIQAGVSAQIANGRLEFTQLPQTGIFQNLNLSGVTKLTVEYDSNYVSAPLGQFSRTLLLGGVSNGAAIASSGFVATGAEGFATNKMAYGIAYGPTGTTASNGIFSKVQTLPYGTYHYVSTFENGFASFEVTDTAGNVLLPGTTKYALPGFTLASMPNLALTGRTSDGVNATTWIDNVKISGLAAPNPPALPPSIAVLATLANAAYDLPNQYIATGKFEVLTKWADNGDGFTATAYIDKSTNQVVIAVRGTNPDPLSKALFYNLLTDGELKPGTVNDKGLLHQYGSELTRFIRSTHDVMPAGATLTLTGHSLGGVLVEMLGKAAGISATGFDAPGSADVFQTFQDQLVASIALLKNLKIQSPGPVTVSNVRLQGDQVSMIGYKDSSHTGQIDGITVTTVLNKFAVNEPTAPTLPEIKKFHSIQTLMQLLNSGDVTTQAGFSNDPDLLPQILKGVQTSCAQPIPGTQCLKFKGLVALANAVVGFDPSPGSDYYLHADPGSPFIASLELPALDGIAGWEVRYLDQFGWSGFTAQTGLADYWFYFTTDVTDLEFIPLNSLGGQGYASDYFVYGLSFASAGEFSATQTEIGAVPEPTSLALVLAAIGGLGLASRSSARRIRNRRLH